MYDYGAKYTDKAISQVDKELRRTYRQAQIELRKKLTDFTRRYAAKDKQKRLLLQQGKITEQEYRDWQAGQVFIKSQWESKIRQIDEVMLNHNQQAMKIINEKRLDVFAENYNYSAFIAEKTIATSFDIYNAEAVARLILDNPQLLPEWKIDEEKDYKWSSEKVNNIIRQGIIQGESIDGITDRLCTDLATQNENKMRMFARTAMTEAQNAGRQQQMQDSADRGIEVHKQWIATIDSRTRDAHRGLDGQEVPFDEDFDSSLGPIEYPGDPKAAPANVFNCRCTMRSIYPKYRNQMQDEPRIAYRDVVDENGNKRRESYYMTDQAEYLKWKEEKKKHKKTIQTGGKYAIYSKKWIQNQKERELQAEKYYEKVRNTDDIKQISKASGFTIKQIETIKHHIFYNDKHKLYDSVGRFPADYDMAVAWKRLSEGKPEERDILLLRHELLEARVEKRYNISVAEAHAIAKKRYPWDVVLEKLLGEDGEEDGLL